MRDREALDEKRKARARAIIQNLQSADYIEGTSTDEYVLFYSMVFIYLIALLQVRHLYERL